MGCVNDEGNIDRDIAGQRSSRLDRSRSGESWDGWDAASAELADRQHGVVARRQLLALGLTRDAIDGRVQAKRLHVVQRGVYAVGRRTISQPGVWMAAVLACGPGALLSHRPAAALLRIRDGAPATVDVTAPRRVRPRPGIRPHRGVILDDERTVHAGIPV